MNREQLLELHDDLCKAAKNIMIAKNQDYAGTQDPFANFRGSKAFGIEPELGIIVRINDKFMRIKSLVESGSLAVKDETVRDSIEDVINYAVLMYGLLKEREDNNNSTVKIEFATSGHEEAIEDIEEMADELDEVVKNVKPIKQKPKRASPSKAQK